MDPAHLVRAARRQAGLSQRDLAARAGLARRTIGAVEAGRQSPSATVLDRLLEAVGLDLVLCPRDDGAEDLELRQHLLLSLTQRLRLALGESRVLQAPCRTAGWAELLMLSRRGKVVVEPPLADALWFPTGPVSPVAVTLHSPHDAPTTVVVQVRLAEQPPSSALIPVILQIGRRVWVSPPSDLALRDERIGRLRQADVLLHQCAARDGAGRRRPAHRDPDECDEEWRLLVTKGASGHRPDPRDSRAWRLDASASLAQRLLMG